MALVLAYDDAKSSHGRVAGDGRDTQGGASQIPFFGGRGKLGLPHASLAEFSPGRSSGAHYHTSDQFSVVVAGKARIGRHPLSLYGVHFSRAYTPYGPFVSDQDTGLTCFIMRARADTGSHHLPHELENLKRVPDRRPWQITRDVCFPSVGSGGVAPDVVLHAVAGVADDQGLAAYTLSMRPNVRALAPDPSPGDGQYLVVVKGSLWYEQKEHRAWTLVFVHPEEQSFQVHAGADGLEALVLNFPKPRTDATRPLHAVRGTTGAKALQCTLCEFIYDEAAGRPEDGIAPGTRWEDIPATWSCPDCSASKSDFRMLERC